MNVPGFVLAAIVGIRSEGSPHKISPSVLHVPSPAQNAREAECLGIIAGGYIFSCSLIQDAYGMLPGAVDLFTARCMNVPDQQEVMFGALYASNLGYLVLAPNTFSVGMSEAGGTESGAGLLADHREKWGDPVRPGQLIFPSGCEQTKIWGYCLDADGRTPRRAKFRLLRDSHKIDFYSDGVGRGSAGSPIFTDDHRLIGFVTASSATPDLNGLPHCLGCRLDMGLPPLLKQRIPWQSVELRAETAGEMQDPEDPWNRQDAEASRQLD